MELVEFKKTKVSDNGSKFEFRYTGRVAKDFVNIEETENKLNEFLENVFENDIQQNIIDLRTVLKDYEESLLVISYKDSEKSEYIGYTNGVIFVYEKKVEENGYRITYDSRKLEYADYNDSSKSFLEQVNDNMSKNALEILDAINQFNDLNSNTLRRNLQLK